MQWSLPIISPKHNQLQVRRKLDGTVPLQAVRPIQLEPGKRPETIFNMPSKLGILSLLTPKAPSFKLAAYGFAGYERYALGGPLGRDGGWMRRRLRRSGDGGHPAQDAGHTPDGHAPNARLRLPDHP